MNKANYLITLCLVGLPVWAGTANWLEVATSADSTTLFEVDLNSIREVKTDSNTEVILQSWMRSTNHKEGTVGNVTIPKGTSMKVLYYFKCASYNIAMKQSIHYTKSGEVFHTEYIKNPEYENTVPESVLDETLDRKSVV